MKPNTLLRAALAAALLSTGAAQAAVIEFDETSVGQLSHTNLPWPLSLVNVHHGQDYVEDGFLLSSSLGGTFLHTLFVPDAGNVAYRPAADSYAMAASTGATTTLTAVDNGAFNVVSIDLARLLTSNLASNGSVTFYGAKAGSSTVVQQTFNYTGSWSTFAFNSNFSNLSSLAWDQGGLFGSKYEFDNISVTAVPEPQTVAMLLAGLGLVGWARRRKQA